MPVLENPWGELSAVVHVHLSHWNFVKHSFRYDGPQSCPFEMNSAVKTDSSLNSIEARNHPLACPPSYSHCRGSNQEQQVVPRKADQTEGISVVVVAMVAAAAAGHRIKPFCTGPALVPPPRFDDLCRAGDFGLAAELGFELVLACFF